MSTIPPTLLSTNLINKPKTSAKKRTAPTNAAPNTLTGLASDASKKTGSLTRIPSNLQSLLAQLEATRIATNSDGDSFSSGRATSGASSLDSRESASFSFTREDDDDVEMSEPPLKRARPQALNLSWTTTEARPEKPPMELFDPLSRDYQRTGLVDLPKVTIPNLEHEHEVEPQELPTLKRHRDQPNKTDAIFDFLLNKR